MFTWLREQRGFDHIDMCMYMCMYVYVYLSVGVDPTVHEILDSFILPLQAI